MSMLNSAERIPESGDVVKSIKLGDDGRLADIAFESGKEICVHVSRPDENYISARQADGEDCKPSADPGGTVVLALDDATDREMVPVDLRHFEPNAIYTVVKTPAFLDRGLTPRAVTWRAVAVEKISSLFNHIDAYVYRAVVDPETGALYVQCAFGDRDAEIPTVLDCEVHDVRMESDQMRRKITLDLDIGAMSMLRKTWGDEELIRQFGQQTYDMLEHALLTLMAQARANRPQV